MHFSQKKVCYKVTLCESRQQESCMVFIGLSIRAKMVGERPLDEHLAKNYPFRNADFG